MRQRLVMLVRSAPRVDVLAVGFLMALPLVYFFPVTLGQQIWYGSDILMAWIPFGTELAVALREGRLPLWAPGMLNGFPLLAEGQVGALYPLNLLLYRFLPVHWAVAYQNLGHIVWAGMGMYALARSDGYHVASALLAAIVFALNGFLISHLIHMPFIITMAWLPWLVVLNRRFQVARQAGASSAGWWLGLVFAIAMQMLAGFPQGVLLSGITVILWGWIDLPSRVKRDWRTVASLGLPWLLGTGIGAVQLIPTFELAQYSERINALGSTFGTTFALHLSALARVVSPLAQGVPDETNNEFWNYVGMLPLILAFLVLFVQREVRTRFLILFALGGVAFAIGDANPLFPFISALPVINYFRAPARFMLFFAIAVALLSATTFQSLSQHLERRSSRRWIVWAGLWGILDLLTVGAVYNQPLDFWAEAWRYLPWVLGLASLIILVLAWARRIERRTFQVAVIGLTIFDLAWFSAPFFHSINPLASPAYVLAEPRSLIALDKTREPYRLFTDEVGIPPFPAIRNALFPNVALIYRQTSANGYTPLAYEGNHPYFLNLTSTMLNLLNARYVFVPLEPTRPEGLVAPRASVRLDLTQHVAISPTLASGIEIISFTQDADTAPRETLVAQLIVETSEGQRETIPLRLGIETADWDYARKVARVSYSQPNLAYSFPAFWRSFGRDFTGYTYKTRFDFHSNHQIVGITLNVIEPNMHLNIVAASLYDEHGQSVSLAQLTGKNDFVVRYLSDTVAVWENLNFLPRAFIVHSAESFTKGLEFYRIQQPSFDPERVVLLDRGPALVEAAVVPAQDWVEITDYQSEIVRLAARANRPGYLVLLDAWYPGWQAFVDGHEVPVYRGDFLFRAIPLEAGEHSIIFEFRPRTFYVGAVISIVSLVMTCLIAIRLRWKTKRVSP